MNLVDELINFINQSTSTFHTVKNMIKILEQNNFKCINNQKWSLDKGQSYYTTVNNSAVVAFTIPEDTDNLSFKIIGTHTDSPGFRIKSNPVINQDSYFKLNTEVYGGPILNTWFDRPLSIAGQVAFKSDDVLNPNLTLIDFKEPIMIIPNLAIHINRDVNDGIKLNPQKDTLPILAYVDNEIDNNTFLNLIATKLGVNTSDILGMDLFLYPTEQGCILGIDKQFISSPRLDDLCMTYSGLHALINNKSNCAVNLLTAFDHEEVGSRTRTGANSLMLNNILERISLSLSKSRDEFLSCLDKSFLISADVAHLCHPNFSEKSDPTNKVLPGNGPTIKISANCSYTSNGDSSAVFANLCMQNNIKYQTFMNPSNMRGGSTIGPHVSAHTCIRTVDIGTPILSMHSIRELMTIEDFVLTTDAFGHFYAI
ncbi:MAG: M18 family aminopeptidase [Epulopiscium sp. Nuni2H_MBin003]|nr:MAG: M18 family aminopeptidase [Epulopiscium sp. Nuni2H_MBin003]